jgi:hypothetical protein
MPLMKYVLTTALMAVGCLLAFGGQQAWAQPRPGIGNVTNPAYSPYLNLLRGGSLTQNYWGLVQPELQWRSGLQNLQQQVTTNGQAIGALQSAAGMPATGHAVQFLNTGSYFPGGGGRGGRGGR